MIKKLTLEEAISEAFGIDKKEIPQFRSYKPFKQARQWLDSQGYKYDYHISTLKPGIVVYAFGAGNPLYSISDGKAENLKGAQIFASLSPKSRSQQRREEAIKNDTSEDSQETEQPPEQPEEEKPKKPRRRKRGNRKRS